MRASVCFKLDFDCFRCSMQTQNCNSFQFKGLELMLELPEVNLDVIFGISESQFVPASIFDI